jgi:hypothetical protein
MEELTHACRAVIELIIPQTATPSYAAQLRKTFPDRMALCIQVGREALRQDVDPALALAIAMNETKFTSPTSARGARGPMGVMPKYVCPKSGAECDYVAAGVLALRMHLDNNDWDYCASLAQYNRGSEGVCREGRSEFLYASAVLDLYEHICHHSDLCHTC